MSDNSSIQPDAVRYGKYAITHIDTNYNSGAKLFTSTVFINPAIVKHDNGIPDICIGVGETEFAAKADAFNVAKKHIKNHSE